MRRDERMRSKSYAYLCILKNTGICLSKLNGREIANLAVKMITRKPYYIWNFLMNSLPTIEKKISTMKERRYNQHSIQILEGLSFAHSQE